MKKSSLLFLLAFIFILQNSFAQSQEFEDELFEYRAIETAVWAMPFMNFKTYRDALHDNGVDYNDVAYNSKIQNWKFQTATPNNTTPYIHFYWNIQDGPIVIELPKSEDGVGVFGTIMDAWQRPIDDVGAKGRDKGNGGKYVLIPEGYNGPLIPGAYTYTQRTNNGFCVLRPIIANASEENLAKATAITKKIKVYPLSEAANPPKMNYVDVYDKMLECTPKMDESLYEEIHAFIQEEPVEDMNLAFMGILKQLGIEKNKPFQPTEKEKKLFAEAAPKALEYMINQYHRELNPWMYEGKKWSVLVPPGAFETDWTYEYPSVFDYNAKGSLYYAIITSIKNYGSATFYLDLAETTDGQWLDGSSNYKLVVPANVPVDNFWAVTTYDLETASYQREIDKATIDSNMSKVKKNKDGSTTIYFGPKAPKGKEANWLPTVEGRRFFLLFRFYGPQKGVFDGSFELNDIEKIK
ncbi:DUF1214 domain-containing protein [Flammeovirga yaeyamensis]|uniref:DUF1214 domain-containing protein n=1 Tax=Flammeovirga yaeyamensis TaxID=367791 RepID=A0AAX1NCH6_9BACT|nr:DUF1254 domain-containing protein [Flammeovirga yaeyamensis]MBB3699482.1 hypothetical protein [Flammeovirga yaeyamensis]NMF35261.1 DUF1254 domain-containing protein [Flammeovirga yaeyamensis]QWG04121.1 DUF1214 domain-containing protein [Flammeovirga yaeyamensis]